MRQRDREALLMALPGLEEILNDIERAEYERWVAGQQSPDDRAKIIAARELLQRIRNEAARANVGEREGGSGSRAAAG